MIVGKGHGNEINKVLMHVSDLEARGKIKQAIKELQEIAKADAKDGSLFNRLGDLFIKENNAKDAVKAYLQGVKIYRKENFERNALALCKKILRHDPGNIYINLIIAELLIELDEKSDALIYFWSYVDKQVAQNNVDEVLKTVEDIKKLVDLDGKMIKKIHDTYKAIGKDSLAEKFVKQAIKEEVPLEDIMEPKTPTVTQKVKKETKAKVSVVPEEQIIDFDKGKKKPGEEVKQLDGVVKDIEAAISQLRKAMRLDEVIVALEGSLTGLSNEQKKAIALLQKSLSLNLDTLQKSVNELHKSSETNARDLRILLKDFSKSLSKLNENQTSFSQKVTETLKYVSSSFNATTKEAFKDIKSVLSVYEKATGDMCSKLDETRKCSTSLLKTNEEMMGTVQQMNDSLIKYIMVQEIKEKKQGKYALIIIIIMIVICGLFVFSILK